MTRIEVDGRTSVQRREPLLDARNVRMQFGGVTALSEVDFSVETNEIVGLVGPNGSGKSTLFAVLSGLLRPNEGVVWFDSEDVTGKSAPSRARMGLARTFQHPELFRDLTVRQHLVLSHRMRFSRRRLWTDFVSARAWLNPTDNENEVIDGLLDLLGIHDIADASVLGLPLGSCRLVEVGRALATSPSLVLLDEPFSGLDTIESECLAVAIRKARALEGVAFAIVEHDVEMILSLSEAVAVLNVGRVIARGTPDEIRQDPEVRSAYLGDEGPRP